MVISQAFSFDLTHRLFILFQAAHTYPIFNQTSIITFNRKTCLIHRNRGKDNTTDTEQNRLVCAFMYLGGI